MDGLQIKFSTSSHVLYTTYRRIQMRNALVFSIAIYVSYSFLLQPNPCMFVERQTFVMKVCVLQDCCLQKLDIQSCLSSGILNMERFHFDFQNTDSDVFLNSDAYRKVDKLYRISQFKLSSYTWNGSSTYDKALRQIIQC